MILQGVKIGGSPRFDTSFRWGYGWNYTRGYTKLNNKEKAYIESIAPKKGKDLRLYLDRSKIDPEIERVGKQIY